MDASHKPAIYLRSALVYYCANAFILVKSKLVIVNRQTVEPSYVYVYVERRRFGVQSVLDDRLVEGGEGGVEVELVGEMDGGDWGACMW